MTELASTTGTRFEEAAYKEQRIREHRGNPFIEALPPLSDQRALVAHMRRSIVVEPEDLADPQLIRMHNVRKIAGGFMEPSTAHAQLAFEFSCLIRNGYCTRNPSGPDFMARWAESRRAMDAVARSGKTGAAVSMTRPIARSEVAGDGTAVIGMSGVGKSTAVDEVLRHYPQVIRHSNLPGGGPLAATLQITWLKVSCPVDGSLKAVCGEFFATVDRLLGTDYYGLYVRQGAGTAWWMTQGMASIAFTQGLGLLVIDECQNLLHARGSNKEELLNYFMMLRDHLKVPIVAIGTEAARSILAGSLVVARRHAGTPEFVPMGNDEGWRRFFKALHAAYYLREPIADLHAFRDELHRLSCGITDIAIKLWSHAQLSALECDEETIDAGVLEAVYASKLHLLHAHLDDVRSRRSHDEAAYERALRQQEALATRPPTAATPPGGARKGRKPRGESLPIAPVEAAPTQGDAERVTSALEEAVATGGHPHAALRAAGHVRDLGLEILA